MVREPVVYDGGVLVCALRYLGHRAGASLSYFTGASVTLRAGEVFVVPEQGFVLGRRASADLRVASSRVAPHHVRVMRHPEGLVVTDLGSTNGTMLDGVTIGTAIARPGARLTLAGDFDFEVVIASACSPIA